MSLKCKSRNENAYIARKPEFRLGCRFLLLKNRQLLLSDFSFYRIEREEMSKLQWKNLTLNGMRVSFTAEEANCYVNCVYFTQHFFDENLPFI